MKKLYLSSDLKKDRIEAYTENRYSFFISLTVSNYRGGLMFLVGRLFDGKTICINLSCWDN